MTKICVFVPTHIYYNNQVNYLSKCLESLLNQTLLPDIYVSVSFENSNFKLMFTEKILKIYGNKIKFTFSNNQKYQMEHLYILIQMYLKKNLNYDLIMFCDDDDTYAPNRVDKFISSYKLALSKSTMEIGGVREYINSSNPEDCCPEYWCYGIKPDIIIEFFNRLCDDMVLLKHKFADTYFRVYLRRINQYKNFGYVGIISNYENGILYNYNENNPNSICYKVENQLINSIDTIQGNLILYLMNQDNKRFNYIKEYYQLTEEKLDLIIPYKNKIITLCNKLYI